MVKKNYDAAENGYESAIEALRKENPKADAIYGLQLLLVETYRQSRNYHKAQDLLNQMEPAIKAKKYVDPTVAVRFWRRKADVEFSCGSRRLGIGYYRKAIAVLEKHFDPNSPTLEKNYLALLQTACTDSDYDTIINIINKLRKSRTEVDNSAPDIVKRAVVQILGRATELADKGNFAEAYHLVQAVKGDNFLLPERVELVTQYSQYCASRGYDKAMQEFIPTLNQLVGKSKELPERESTSLQMKIHLCLASCSAKAGTDKNSQCVKHWEKMLSLSRSQKPPLTTRELHLRALAISGLAMSREMPWGRSTDEAIRMIQEPIKFSESPHFKNLSLADRQLLRDTHVTTRICLAWAHVSRGETAEAEAALSSIDRELLKEHPESVGRLLVATFYLDVAKQYLEKHNQTKCDQTVATAKELVKGIPNSPELTKFWEKYHLLLGVTKTKS